MFYLKYYKKTNFINDKTIRSRTPQPISHSLTRSKQLKYTVAKKERYIHSEKKHNKNEYSNSFVEEPQKPKVEVSYPVPYQQLHDRLQKIQKIPSQTTSDFT